MDGNTVATGTGAVISAANATPVRDEATEGHAVASRTRRVVAVTHTYTIGNSAKRKLACVSPHASSFFEPKSFPSHPVQVKLFPPQTPQASRTWGPSGVPSQARGI